MGLRLPNMKRFPWLLLILVIIPTSVTAIYYGLIASDVFVSESRFVVRSPERQSVGGLGVILQGIGFSNASDDVHTVHNYMLSRDAISRLDSDLQVESLYAEPQIDPLSRFGGLWRSASREDFYRYYQERVQVSFDAQGSISTLSVRAYSAQAAHDINERLLLLGEDLVNRINSRARADLIRYATQQVEESEGKARAAALALAEHRTATRIVDPAQQASAQLNQVYSLQSLLVQARARLEEVRTFAPRSPQIAALQNNIKSLQGEIDRETSKMVGGADSLAGQSGEFQRLMIDNEFAERQLTVAMQSLEQARMEAQRKQIYLERVVQPNVPDVAMEPLRWRNVLATFGLGMVLYGVASLLLAGVREHRD